MEFLYAALGLVILIVAGDLLVRGAVNLSLRLGVPALIVSLTIVAFGTSAPELLISISAVLDGAPGIALGNVVGSNTANVLLVLGLPALFAGLWTAGVDTKKTCTLMLAATALFVVLLFMGPMTWWHGLILLSALGYMLWDAFRDAQREREIDVEGADPAIAGWKIAVFLILGLIGLPVGAEILVQNAMKIALSFGISETAIGLTLVAFGTSLPELATTVSAAIRKNADVALGNVIGSNMFNLLAIIGITTLVGPLPVDGEMLRFDIWVMVAAALVLIPFVYFRQNITRFWGGGMFVGYIGYIWIIFAGVA